MADNKTVEQRFGELAADTTAGSPRTKEKVQYDFMVQELKEAFKMQGKTEADAELLIKDGISEVLEKAKKDGVLTKYTKDTLPAADYLKVSLEPAGIEIVAKKLLEKYKGVEKDIVKSLAGQVTVLNKDLFEKQLERAQAAEDKRDTFDTDITAKAEAVEQKKTEVLDKLKADENTAYLADMVEKAITEQKLELLAERSQDSKLIAKAGGFDDDLTKKVNAFGLSASEMRKIAEEYTKDVADAQKPGSGTAAWNKRLADATKEYVSEKKEDTKLVANKKTPTAEGEKDISKKVYETAVTERKAYLKKMVEGDGKVKGYGTLQAELLQAKLNSKNATSDDKRTEADKAEIEITKAIAKFESDNKFAGMPASIKEEIELQTKAMVWSKVVSKNKEELIKKDLLTEAEVKAYEDASKKVAQKAAEESVGKSGATLKYVAGAGLVGLAGLAVATDAFKSKEEVMDGEGKPTGEVKKKLSFIGKVAVTIGIIGGLALIANAATKGKWEGNSLAEKAGNWVGLVNKSRGGAGGPAIS